MVTCIYVQAKSVNIYNWSNRCVHGSVVDVTVRYLQTVKKRTDN